MVWWLQYDNFNPSNALTYNSIEETLLSLKAAATQAKSRNKSQEDFIKDLNSLVEGDDWYPTFLYDFQKEEPKCCIHISKEILQGDISQFEESAKNNGKLYLIESNHKGEFYINNERKENEIQIQGAFQFFDIKKQDFILNSKYGLINIKEFSCIIESQLNVSQFPASFEDFLEVAKYGSNRFPLIAEDIHKYKFNDSLDFPEDNINFSKGKELNRALDEGVNWESFTSKTIKLFNDLIMKAALDFNKLDSKEIITLEKILKS